MSRQQQQQQLPQQQGAPSQAPAPHQPTRKEQLLTMIATLQQQVNNMLLAQQGSRVEVARPQVFSGRMEDVSTFINAVKGAKETISLARAKDAAPGSNCMLKSLWG